MGLLAMVFHGCHGIDQLQYSADGESCACLISCPPSSLPLVPPARCRVSRLEASVPCRSMRRRPWGRGWRPASCTREHAREGPGGLMAFCTADSYRPLGKLLTILHCEVYVHHEHTFARTVSWDLFMSMSLRSPAYDTTPVPFQSPGLPIASSGAARSDGERTDEARKTWYPGGGRGRGETNACHQQAVCATAPFQGKKGALC